MLLYVHFNTIIDQRSPKNITVFFFFFFNPKLGNRYEEGGEEEEEEDDDENDELLDEIYRDYKNDPWWSSTSNKNKNKNSTSKTTTRRGWHRFQHKTKSFLKGAHHIVTKVQEHAPHVLKGIKLAAALLGKKKRELMLVERKQKHLKREIEELQDELARKRK